MKFEKILEHISYFESKYILNVILQCSCARD